MKRYRKIAVLVCSVLIWIGIALPQESKFEEGEKYLKERNYAKAIGIFREILDRPGWDELSPKAALRLGQCYLALKDYENARRFFNEAMEWGGDIVGEANIGIAITYINEKKYDQAIEVLSNIISQYKTDTILAYAYFNRGLAYEGKKWIGKALNDFVKAKEKAKDDEELLAAIDGELKKCRSLQQQFLREEDEYLQKIRSAQGMGDWDGCAGLLRELAKVCEDWGEMELAIDYERKAGAYSSSEEFKAGSLMSIAWRYYKIRDYEKAADAFKQVGEGYPQSSYAKESLLRLGDMYGYLKRYDDAITVYTSFLEKYPSDSEVPSAKMKIAWCYFNKGDYEKSAEAFQQVANEYPQSEEAPTALLQAGNSYVYAGKNEEAIKTFQLLLERYPQSDKVIETMMNLAWRYREKKDREREEEILKEINKRAPDSELGWFALGLYYEDKGEYEKAIETYKKAAEFYGAQRPLALLGMGSSFFALARFNEAFKYFQRVVKEYPESSEFCPEAYYLTARIWVYSGDYKRAIEYYKAIVEKYPNNRQFALPTLLEIPYCYECLYDFQSAINEYQRVMEKYPEYYDEIAPMALLRMGHCYLQIGKIGKAIETWQSLKEKFPDLGFLRGTVSLPHIINLYKDMPQEVPSFIQYTSTQPKPTLVGPISTANRLGLASQKGRMLIVYGTKGSPEDIEAMLENAMEEREYTRANAGIPLEVKKDIEVTEADIKSRHLMIIGSPQCNTLLERINDKLPIKIVGDAIVAGDREYRGKRVGVFMAVPNPLNPEKYAIIDMAISPKDYFPNLIGVPCWNVDYAILEATKPSNTLLEEGFFIKPSPENWIVRGKK